MSQTLEQRTGNKSIGRGESFSDKIAMPTASALISGAGFGYLAFGIYKNVDFFKDYISIEALIPVSIGLGLIAGWGIGYLIKRGINKWLG